MWIACSDPCAGVECSSGNIPSQVSAFFGSESIESEQESSTYIVPDGNIVGFDALGNNWSIAIKNGLFIGIPNLGIVLRVEYTQTQIENQNLISSSETNIAYGAKISLLSGSDTSYLVVAAPRYQQSLWQQGAVYILSEDGSTQHTLITGTSVQEQLGDHIYRCADLDGDNIEDALLASSLFGGSLNNEDNPSLAGRVYIANSSQWLTFGESSSASQLPYIDGESIGARLGYDARCSEDIDGDNEIDIIVSSPFADSSTLDASGVIYVLPKDNPNIENAIFRLQGTTSNSWLGWSIATGDFDGDKHIDIAAGAPGENNALGSVYIWRGADLLERQTSPTIEFRSDTSRIGTKVEMGDINGDGVDDLFISEIKGDSTEHSEAQSGITHVFFGSEDSSAYSGIQSLDSANIRFSIPISNALFGREIAFADLNQDNIEDVIFLHNAENQ